MFVLQDIGETALHLAVVREMGNSLHLVDFLVQNMPTQALDKVTLAPSDSTGSGSNTVLHLCALHDKPECMKLLLRSGADPTLRNAQDKTPLDIAQDRGHHSCEELVSHPPCTCSISVHWHERLLTFKLKNCVKSSHYLFKNFYVTSKEGRSVLKEDVLL